MTDKITSGRGVGSAFTGAISDKLKARATGVKEKFDPMNIAKFMTGGSRLGPAILGRLTGRSQSDIDYFAGNKNKKNSYTQVPTSMATPGENLGGSAVSVLNKMLSFMVMAREEDIKKRDTSKQFIEEQKVEEQRRHNEFLSILREYTSLSATTTLVSKKEEDGGSLLDLFKDSKKLLSLAKLLTPLLVNPLTLTIGAVLAAAYGLKKVAEFIPNARVITPLEAQAALGGSEYDIKGLGGYDFLVKRITEGPEEAQKTLNDFAEGKITFKELQSRGGEAKLKEIATQKGLEVPAQRQTELPNSVTPRPTGSGLAVPSKQKKWDILYGEDYNPDGTPKRTVTPQSNVSEAVPVATQADVRKVDNAAMSAPAPETTAPSGVVSVNPKPSATPIDGNPTTRMPLPDGVEPSTAGGGRGFVNPPSIKPEETITTPVPQTPLSSRMNDVVSENQTLSLNITGNTQTPVSPIISTINNSNNTRDKPIPATATVRDTTPILDHVIQMSVVPI